jgi:iron-sulfur cluster assembly accessory protein
MKRALIGLSGVAAVGLILVALWRVRAGAVDAAASPVASREPRFVDASAAGRPLPPVKGLTLTDRAAAKVKEISSAEKLAARLRVRVVGSDGGFLYDAYFEDQPSPLDDTFESKGVDIVVDPLSLQYLDGTTIDYVETEAGAGFKFDNPNGRP